MKVVPVEPIGVELFWDKIKPLVKSTENNNVLGGLGGFGAVYDYGPLGVELKNNIATPKKQRNHLLFGSRHLNFSIHIFK